MNELRQTTRVVAECVNRAAVATKQVLPINTTRIFCQSYKVASKFIDDALILESLNHLMIDGDTASHLFGFSSIESIWLM